MDISPKSFERKKMYQGGESLKTFRIIKRTIGVLILCIPIYHLFIEEIQLSPLLVFIFSILCLLITVSEKIIIEKAKENRGE